ncbi:class I SAM-dependent methyltransferase [Cyclobacterium sp. 1_MG-2023]|uniref:class I SAM-dependent methyltransferase n=1 Tax=Cyclobacterium sp. 1_MG-2023 TaxID=3062681 RepID=UPI0026E40916|nr:class I SAM-dependent methyltransferase [Cyclobacterium sp. 1_MG-2023]MDO6438203.1 class I SAM-dependent methyltransferase [Cyclobacterium sp. 1_MG-2023]
MKSMISWTIRHIPRKYLQLFSHFFLKVAAVIYTGSTVTCNICQRGFRKFLPYGRIARENALCPNCLGLERHRLMWLFLQKETDFFTAPKKVLHVAPELCFLGRFKKLKNLEYITGDIESPLADVKMDIHHIPFEDNSFDVVFCNHVMEHVEDDIKACAEINRVLKPNGWGIIQSPVYEHEVTLEDKTITDPKERERVFGQSDHVRKYGKDYARRLSKSGLRVTENNFVKQLSEDMVKKYALPEKEIIFYCQKGQ